MLTGIANNIYKYLIIKFLYFLNFKVKKNYILNMVEKRFALCCIVQATLKDTA